MAINRILLLSSAHPPNDPRIVGKILPSLSTYFEVEYYLPKRTYGHILSRFFLIHPTIFFKFLKVRPQIVYIFVAELLPMAFIFRCFGSTIIYEVQENLYKKIPTKTRNKSWLFRKIFSFFDQRARQYFYFVFTEDAYLNEYSNLKNPCRVIHNFAKQEWTKKPFPKPYSIDFFYAGVISLERGLDTIIAAITILKVKYPTIKLHFFGRLNINIYEVQNIDNLKDNLIFYGYTDQDITFKTAQNCIAGLALLKPVGDYPDSYPSKIFDYMALGLPVITADFEIYKKVVEASNCGFCISAFDTQTLIHKMEWLIENPIECHQMGQNGRSAIIEKYSWENEAEKLIELCKIVERFNGITENLAQ